MANVTGKQAEIKKKYVISKDLVRLLDILHKLYVMTDQRKKFHFLLNYAYHEILKKLGKFCSLNLMELKYLQVEEILEMFKKNNYSDSKKLAQKRIKSPLMVRTVNGNVTSVKEGEQVLAQLDKFTLKVEKLKEFSGQVASKNTDRLVKGTAKIIMSSNEVKKMRKDEILVTAMTTPDFIPAMRMARAIVTDEGGITSHAAIVSRELGIPCIIGTRVATKVLKDGYKIQLDTQKGIIRIL